MSGQLCRTTWYTDLYLILKLQNERLLLEEDASQIILMKLSAIINYRHAKIKRRIRWCWYAFQWSFLLLLSVYISPFIAWIKSFLKFGFWKSENHDPDAGHKLAFPISFWSSRLPVYLLCHLFVIRRFHTRIYPETFICFIEKFQILNPLCNRIVHVWIFAIKWIS